VLTANGDGADSSGGTAAAGGDAAALAAELTANGEGEEAACTVGETAKGEAGAGVISLAVGPTSTVPNDTGGTEG
jgi:hypothetical protein